MAPGDDVTGTVAATSQVGHRLHFAAFEQALARAAIILQGPVNQADSNSYVFPVLLFKWVCAIYDEERQTATVEMGGAVD
jgi:hypothetical protein